MTTLMPHQVQHIQYNMSHTRSADWSECGVGKSLIALTKFQELCKLGLARRLLIACPLSVMTSWTLEIEKHTNLSYCKLVGSMEQKVKMITANDKDVYIITYDSIPFREGTKPFVFMALRELGFDMLVGDEITHIKNIRARRTRALIALCDEIEHVLFLSATPIPRKVEDIFTIYLALDYNVFGEPTKAIKYYMHNVCYKYPNWKLLPGRADELQRKLYSVAIRTTKAECLTLPKKIWLPRDCQLTDEQRRIYQEIATDLSADLGATRVTVKNVAGKMAKLSQIADGFLYTPEGTYSICERPHKAEVMAGILQEEIPQDEKVLIYAHWWEDIEIIEKTLVRVGVPYVTLHGQMPQKSRDAVIHTFTNYPASRCRALVSQTEVGGFGLNLPQASNIIYFSLSFSLTNFIQSQDRIHRIGQDEPCRYFVLLATNTVDLYIYKKILQGVELSSALLDEKEITELREAIYESLKQ